MNSTQTERLIRSHGVVKRRIAGEVFLIPVTGEVAELQRIFVLSATGEYIWDLLATPCTGAGLADELASAFDVQVAEAQSDCEAFLREMRQHRLVIPAA